MNFKVKYLLLFFLVALLPVHLLAQKEKLALAINALSVGKIDSAKIYIDEAIIHPETAKDYYTWYVKGHTYLTYYKTNSLPLILQQALEAYVKSIELDEKKENVNENKQGIIKIASIYNNISADGIDSLDYEKAIKNFEAYKKALSYIDSSPEIIKQKDIEFNLALETVYSELYDSTKNNDETYANLQIKALEYVLKLDSLNFTANKNLGIVYYHKAANSINNKLDYDADLILLINVIQENKYLFEIALKYMKKAYELSPKDITVIKGMKEIYRGLNDDEKADFYNKKIPEGK